MGKRNAVVIDDGTPYGRGLADGFAGGFAAAGRAIAARRSVKVGGHRSPRPHRRPAAGFKEVDEIAGEP
jgi:hypothetical protein